MMKKPLLTIFLVICAAVGANAQIAKPVSEDAKSPEKIIQNAPFSAEAVTESVQILWDGTKIVRKMSSKLYRDREGRFRREDSKMQLGVPGQNVEIAGSIRIIDPVAGFKYLLDVEDRKYKRSDFGKKFELKTDSKFNLVKENEWNLKKEADPEKRAEQQAKRNEQQDKRNKQQAKRNEEKEKAAEKQIEKEAEKRVKEVEQGMQQVETGVQTGSVARVEEGMQRIETGVQRIDNAVDGNAKPEPVYGPGDKKPAVKISTNEDKKGPKSSTESLGVQTIEGVTVEGTRTTTTIPMGTIGNDRDINVVYEKWYSKELQMTVFSKHTDPRFGEQTYRLSNISRENPPISLFSPPADFRDDDDDDGDGDGDGDGNGRTKKPRVPAKPSPPKVTADPPAIGKPAGQMPKKPVI
jgi:hypothetical protein